MQCHQFETMRRWLAARLRAQRVNVDPADPIVAAALRDSSLASLPDVIRLDDVAIAAIARRMGLVALTA